MNTEVRYLPLGFQQIGSATLAAATALTVPTGANMAVIRSETANVRWRDDGVAPTTSAGMLMTNSDAPYEYSGRLSALQFIAAAGSPVLDVTYYRIDG